MPKLNKFLVTSIIADIRECVCVANEIYSWVGGIEHLSWKFPTKTAKDINAMEIVKEHTGTAGELYILLLELAYDRIQFVLRLIVEFMDKYPFVEDFFKEVSCVTRPNQISLASLLQLVWNRLKTLPESISRHMVKNGEDEMRESFTPKVSRKSQAGGSVNYCESCTIAGEAVLQAINVIERVFVENKLVSVAVTERNESRYDIYESTQWAVMSRLTKGIGRDVETAMTTMRESNLTTEAVIRNQEETIQDLRANSTRQEEGMDALKAKNSELEDVLENARGELDATKRNNVSLVEENETLKEILEHARRQTSALAGGNNILQSQAGTLAESKLELERTVIRLRKEVIDVRDACLDTERRFQALLEESRKENDSIKHECGKEIEKLQREIVSLRASIANGRGNERIKGTGDNNSNKGVQEEMILTPEDDPVADMTRQLISNREKIELLSRQNDRLSKALHRLREHRLTTTNGSNK